MNVQLRGLRLAREFPEALSKLFLKIVVQAVLSAEENHSSLGNCAPRPVR